MKTKLLLLILSACLLATAACASNVSVNTTTVNNSLNAANANANDTSPTIAVNAANDHAQTASAAAIMPDALVADLYRQHDAKKSPFFQTKNRALLDKYFAKSLADMIWKDATTTNPGEVGALDFDPLYNAQDLKVKNLKVGQADIQNDTAKVPVSFTNYGTSQTVNFNLVKESGNWKIKDINYGDFTLTSVYKENEKAQKSGGDKEDSANENFEGKYQVGDTTCTVTPIKMAFEVKWAKGTGSEIFFSQDNTDGKYSFKSDPQSGKPNVFSFDDENYTTGTFHRADGKDFPVKRIS